MGRTVLVTGGSGMVGQGIKWARENRGKEDDDTWVFLSSKDCDLLDYAAVDALFEKYKPYGVIHLAAIVGGLFKNMREPSAMLTDNIILNENVLKAAKKYDTKKLVSALSTCIFPDKPPSYPIDETMLHQGPPHNSNEGYAHAKRMLEVSSRMYRKQYGCNFVNVIPTNIYGPHDNWHLEDAHVLPALIHKCKLAKEKGEPFKVMGTGKPLRQFLYSRDLGEILIRVLESYDEESAIVLTPNEEYSIEDVARMVARSFDMEDKLTFVGGADGQFKKTADGTKLQKFLESTGGYELTKMDKAMADTVAWFKENYETCRK